VRGLSPRVRRYRPHPQKIRAQLGSISACAEVPFAEFRPLRAYPVYLRVCGGTAFGMDDPERLKGLSPRVRRYLEVRRLFPASMGSISACAEVPFRTSTCIYPDKVYLRVCGGTDPGLAFVYHVGGLSPRVRRYLRPFCEAGRGERSISACAEVPTTIERFDLPKKVYLRVCGGTLNSVNDAPFAAGLSPRVRRYHCDTLSGRAIDWQVR